MQTPYDNMPFTETANEGVRSSPSGYVKPARPNNSSKLEKLQWNALRGENWPPQKNPDGTREAAKFLWTLFKNFRGHLIVRLWNGKVVRLGNSCSNETPMPFELHFRSEHAVRCLVLGSDPLRMADAYFRDDIDVTGDFFAVLKMADLLGELRPSFIQRMRVFFQSLHWKRSGLGLQKDKQLIAMIENLKKKPTPKNGNGESIAAYYPANSQFYRLWLDADMRYACALFQHKSDSLALAQRQKMDDLCKKLLLKPGDRLLEIGCSWGTLAMHAAKYFGARVHGITSNKEQWAWANSQIVARGLTGRVFIDLRNYKDIEGSEVYDKVCNVDLFEHIKPRNLSVYLNKVNQLLKPGGLLLQQIITQEQESTSKTLSSGFINRYAYPPNDIVTLQHLECIAKNARFEIKGKDELSKHYATTLRRWVGRLEEKHADALKYVSEPNYRIWRLFMSANALEFESGNLCLTEVLAHKSEAEEQADLMAGRHLQS